MKRSKVKVIGRQKPPQQSGVMLAGGGSTACGSGATAN